jgi:MoxR-like ATPase
MIEEKQKDWKILTGSCIPHDGINDLPPPPPWRRFNGEVKRERRFPSAADLERQAVVGYGDKFQFERERPEGGETGWVIPMVNAALYLRRPLLVTGKPGTGKSSLIQAVAYELKLGEVIEWPITSRSTLRESLYVYDAIGRLQEQHRQGAETDISGFLQLGPLGTALLPTHRPRALLIDEIDKSDLDLPNDLLYVFEKGEYRIPELERLGGTREIRDHTGEKFEITDGYVKCREFPFIVITSNGEREFPEPFLRRCLQLTMDEPSDKLLARIIHAHLGPQIAAEAQDLITTFLHRLEQREPLATDQLLSALYLVKGSYEMNDEERAKLEAALLQPLTSA